MKEYVVRMSAGLANRMLQYSYYLFLKKKGYKVYVDNTYKAKKWKMEDIEWEKIFPFAPINQATPSLIFRYAGGDDIFSKIRRHYFPFLSSYTFLKNAFCIPTEADLKKYHFLVGTFQDARMVDMVKSEVLSSFRFKKFEINSKNANLEEKMKVENSVAIHVRKGKDYLIRPDFQGTCPIEYYKNAIDIIKERIGNDFTLYVFTDNPSWVKENFKDLKYTLVDGNPAIGWGNHYDMQLMSSCKHNIIANSTYSWWGAYLNRNPNKIVIAPQKWYNNSMIKYRGVENVSICDGWIAL